MPFGGNPIFNSQCFFNPGISGAGRGGTDLILTLSFTFRSGFSGLKTVAMRATSNVGSTTGWVNRGEWTVP